MWRGTGTICARPESDRFAREGFDVKKIMCYGVLAVLVLLLANPLPSHAGGGRGYVGVNIGVGHGYWGPRYGWGFSGGWGPSYYYYATPPVVVQQPPVYVQPPQAPQYWYYCQNPQGYYPYVQQCPPGWMKVVPPDNPPDR